MLYIKMNADENGGHMSQRTGRALKKCPVGYIEVPAELEEKVLGMLPFVQLTIQNGILIDAAENKEAREAYEAMVAQEQETMEDLAADGE